MSGLAPWESALDAAARLCAVRVRNRPFPDLSDTLVLLPGLHAAAALRERIRDESAHAALILPAIHSLTSLAGTLAPARRAAEQRARLLLLDLLRGHPGLTGGGDAWTLVEALLSLFAELDDRLTAVPDDAGSMAESLRGAYGAGVPDGPLRREAALVATLWHAWRERRGGALGDGAAAVAALDAWVARGGRAVIVTVADPLPPVVERWLADAPVEVETVGATRCVGLDEAPGAFEALASAAIATHCVAPTSPPEAIVDAATMIQRGRALARAWPEPPRAERFAVAAADDAEHEARTVDVQVRLWWLAGHRRIAVVTEDRKLARRVRALLARAGIALDDSGGWALSTTSAAAALERWLETIEEDFRASPLLDLMKSPFCPLIEDRDEQLATAWQFEEGVVRREQVARGLDPYRRAARRRAARLPDGTGDRSLASLERLFDRVEHGAAPLLRHARAPQRAFPASELTAALQESLMRVGLHDGLADDAAGRRVLDELAAMARAAADGDAPALNWREWRTWLGRTLERAVFRDPSGGSVSLMTLDECDAGGFDAVVIAGTDAEHLPGRPHAHPFFNDAVRAQLGLDTWVAARARAADRFRRALSLAPRCVVTWAHADAHAERLPSPWLAGLDAMHALAWGRAPAAPDALRIARDPLAQVVDRSARLPGESTRPRPRADHVPTAWSAGAHQDLIDCPYRWFAARRLGLDAPEPLRDALSKQEFGELVHRCLHAFHADVPGLPGPFGTQVDEQNRDEALALLLALGDAVLADAAATDFTARAWLRAWRRAAPAVVDFEAARALDGWRVEHVEHAFEFDVSGVTLRGRIDRVERRGDERSVLDYKTGAIAKLAAVADGEHVQLASYAAAVGGATEVGFVALAPALDGDAVRVARLPSTRHADASVDALVTATVARLGDMVGMLRGGAELPAWGDADACRYCRYAGLCRRDTWSDA